jgi:hypothetical protein
MSVILLDFNRRLIISTEFRKMLKFRAHENPCSSIRIVLYGRIDKKEESNSKSYNGKVHVCTGTEALYRPYGPYGE